MKFQFDLTEIYQWPDMWDILLNPRFHIQEHKEVPTYRITEGEWRESCE
jgi:hypothetical protein